MSALHVIIRIFQACLLGPKLTVEKLLTQPPHPFHNNMEHFPVRNSGGWIPRQSEEEVMTQVAVRPTAGRAKFNMVLLL